MIKLRSRTPLIASSATRSALSKINRPDLAYHAAIERAIGEFICCALGPREDPA
jgi:hypothetical protein